MLPFARRHRALFSGVLLIPVLFAVAGCYTYKQRRSEAANTIQMLQLYMVDEVFPTDFAWRIDAEAVLQSGVQGRITHLTPKDAYKVATGYPQAETEQRKLQIVVFYVDNQYAQSLVKSNAATVDLPYTQVKRTEVFEYNTQKSSSLTFLGGMLLGPIIGSILLGLIFS